MEALGHTWRVIAQFDVTPDDALQIISSDDRRPDEQLVRGEAPAPDDARPWLGLHNLVRDEMVVACLRCEMAFTKGLAEQECRGDPDGYSADGAPTWNGKTYDDGPVKGNVDPRRFGAVGRNDMCPCGSGKKFKRCCGA